MKTFTEELTNTSIEMFSKEMLSFNDFYSDIILNFIFCDDYTDMVSIWNTFFKNPSLNVIKPIVETL